MPSLSAVIITLNEQANIAACLDSVAFCDERIVVDGGSTDATAVHRDGARAHAVVAPPIRRVRRAEGVRGTSLATGEWILSVDADERVSPELAAAIKEAIAGDGHDGYEISRLSYFCGRPMRHSGWYPDHVLRLFRRGRGRFTERPRPRAGDLRRAGSAGSPARCIITRSSRLEQALSRVDRYSTAGAAMLVASGRRRSRSHRGSPTDCGRSCAPMCLRLGFLDGREGFLLAVANAEGTYYRYMKAWLARRRDG